MDVIGWDMRKLGLNVHECHGAERLGRPRRHRAAR